jgi:hypothetical protein
METLQLSEEEIHSLINKYGFSPLFLCERGLTREELNREIFKRGMAEGERQNQIKLKLALGINLT